MGMGQNLWNYRKTHHPPAKKLGKPSGYCLGFGLSYTSYSYSELSTAAAGSTVEVTVQASHHSEVMEKNGGSPEIWSELTEKNPWNKSWVRLDENYRDFKTSLVCWAFGLMGKHDSSESHTFRRGEIHIYIYIHIHVTWCLDPFRSAYDVYKIVEVLISRFDQTQNYSHGSKIVNNPGKHGSL